MSYLADYRIGTVGNLLTGVNIKLAEDGETLNKGDNIFNGYWKMEEEARHSFTENGYFIGGDIGRLDDDGLLSIMDRKKNMNITSGGKNIAPQKIEGFFLMDSKGHKSVQPDLIRYPKPVEITGFRFSPE